LMRTGKGTKVISIARTEKDEDDDEDIGAEAEVVLDVAEKEVQEVVADLSEDKDAAEDE